MATIAAVTSDDPRGQLTSDPKVRQWLELPAFALTDRQIWNMANIAAAIALVRGPAAAGDLADRAVEASVEDAETHDERAEATGSTPAELVAMLLAAGLDAPVIAALQTSSMGDGWRAARESIRAQLVRHLAAKGAEEEALAQSIQLTHLGYGTTKTEIIAAAAQAAYGTSRWEEYRGYARTAVEAEFGRKVAAERTARLYDARLRIQEYLRGEPTSDVPAPKHERIEFYLERLGELSSPSDDDFRSDLLENLAAALPEHALADPADARQLVPRVQLLVDERLTGYRWFRARHRLVATYIALGNVDAAGRLATVMIEPLIAMEFVDPSAIADTVAALHAAGALIGDTVAPLLAMAAPDHLDDDYVRRDVAVAFAKGSIGGPRQLAESAADLITDPVPSPGQLSATWYKPALEVLAGLVEGEHAQPARRVALTLLQQVARTDVLWTDRAAILGGLLKSNEPTVRDEALRRLTLEDGFIDHVIDLPTELLEALLRTATFTGPVEQYGA